MDFKILIYSDYHLNLLYINYCFFILFCVLICYYVYHYVILCNVCYVFALSHYIVLYLWHVLIYDPSFYLSILLSIFLSISLSLSKHLPTHTFIQHSSTHLSIYRKISTSAHSPTYLPIHPLTLW